jgi:ABC-type antimicrobial peptide transport system permease subunit
LKLLAYTLSAALESIRHDRRRLLPMALGIVWGMAAVMVLLAVAAGFEGGQRRALAAYGDRFVLLRLNRAELDRAAGGVDKRLMMDAYDVDRLRQGAPAIRRLSPVNMAYRTRITARHGAGSQTSIAGTLPEIRELRHLPLVEGRFFDESDEAERRRVIVLGPTARKQLFGNGPAVGQTVRIAGFSNSTVMLRESARSPLDAGRRGAGAALAGSARSGSAPSGSAITGSASPSSAAPTSAALPAAPSRAAPSSASSSGSAGAQAAATPRSALDRDVRISGELFEVIGVLADVEIQRESYVSVSRLAFVPFSTSCAVFSEKYNTLFIEPRSIEERELALRQLRQVMGSRYGFEPDDENAVLIYFDSIERARSIEAIFGALRLFLALVGVLILAIGAIGVMNVVLVSVAARRFEIGLRKAMGATPAAIYLQFFLETALGCLASGGVGFFLGYGCIALLGIVPLPQGISRPELDAGTALLAFGLLALVATTVGLFPARQAARLAPVAALRTKG